MLVFPNVRSDVSSSFVSPKFLSIPFHIFIKKMQIVNGKAVPHLFWYALTKKMDQVYYIAIHDIVKLLYNHSTDHGIKMAFVYGILIY